MKILITGGTGFVGKHVQKAFQPYAEEHSFSFIGSSCDLTCENNVNDLFRAVKPDIVIHMAAVCGGILANKNSPAVFLRDNLHMSLNVYNAAVCVGKKDIKLYTLGSVCAYPKYCPTPFKEDNIWNGYPEETNAPYGQAKRTLMLLGQTYRAQYGIGGAHLIPVNMYGEHDHFDLTNSHVIPALINKFVDAVKNNKPSVECWGTGEATREFLYAGDSAEAIVKAVMMKLDTDLPINLGTGKDISIKDLAYLIGNLTGFTGQIVFNGQVSDGQPKRQLDVTRAKQILGFEAKTALKDGLLKTIEWYKREVL